MTEQVKTRDEKFIETLEGYVENENRAALADLRRGLGKSFGEGMEIYRCVVPYANEWNEEDYALVASLFALHQISWRDGETNRKNKRNLGASINLLAPKAKGDEPDNRKSVERRFVALLNADGRDFRHHLRQAISLLKSKDVPVDWLQLLKDVKGWNWDSRDVQRRWARSFWGKVEDDENASPDATEISNEDENT